MDIADLTKKENELCSIVLGLRGTMEEKSAQLRDRGVFDAYKQIHSSYADKADKDLESLKRGLFIQWYSMTEPSCFTGINELDSAAENKIIEQVDKLIKHDKVDSELNWMLKYYSTWDYVFERFKEYHGLRDWIKNDLGTDLPDTIDNDEMSKRGQMGKYWTSLNHFVK
jgi:hypothetical protein